MAISDKNIACLEVSRVLSAWKSYTFSWFSFKYPFQCLKSFWFRITQGKISSGWPVIASWSLMGSSPLVILVTQRLSYISTVSMVTVAGGVRCWYVMCYVRCCWLNNPLWLKLPRILYGTAIDIIGFSRWRFGLHIPVGTFWFTCRRKCGRRWFTQVQGRTGGRWR